MPSERTPRREPLRISEPLGSSAPSRATGTRSPSWTFQAPVTIWTGAVFPTSRLRTHMWSESGWRSMVRTRPTTTFFRRRERSSVTSTLEPETVMASAKLRSSTSVRGRSTNSLSHFLERFMPAPP